MLKNVVLMLSYLLAVTYSNNCNFNVKIKQTLRNEGFHRNMTYEIVFNGNEDDEPWIYQDCVVGLDQMLPAGVYVNPDELGDLKRANKLDVILKNRINIELPAEQSGPSSVHILGKVVDGKASLWVPVHARYHRAAPGGGMSRNTLPPPRLYLRCPPPRPRCARAAPLLCNGGSEQCWKGYQETTYTMLTDTLIWDVPIGDTDHYYLVAAGTGLVLVVGSLYLLQAVHRYQIAGRKKRL